MFYRQEHIGTCKLLFKSSHKSFFFSFIFVIGINVDSYQCNRISQFTDPLRMASFVQTSIFGPISRKVIIEEQRIFEKIIYLVPVCLQFSISWCELVYIRLKEILNRKSQNITSRVLSEAFSVAEDIPNWLSNSWNIYWEVYTMQQSHKK